MTSKQGDVVSQARQNADQLHYGFRVLMDEMLRGGSSVDAVRLAAGAAVEDWLEKHGWKASK
jgi:hypothetical protein